MEEPIIVSYISCSFLVLYFLVSARLKWVQERNEEGRVLHNILPIFLATLIQLIVFAVWLTQLYGGYV